MLAFRGASALLAALFILAAPAGQAEDPRVTQLARQVLADLQTRSIRQNREYCGLILRLPDKRLALSRVVRGKRATCRFPNPRQRGEIVASFHTHSAFHDSYDNEVPSLTDLDVMVQAGLDGYVSTPGGRFWIVEGAQGRVRLLCGPGCLPYDGRYDAESDRHLGEIRTLYTRKTLAARSGTLGRDDFTCGNVLCTD